MAWFNRSRKKQDEAQEAERITREVGELFNPYDERTSIVEDGKILLEPGKVLENIRDRMERISLDPAVVWAPDEIMSPDEGEVLCRQLNMGRLLVSQSAWYAREHAAAYTARFDAQDQAHLIGLVEHPIADEARISMFVDGTTFSDNIDIAARKVLNRALASAEEVESHPELDDLDADELLTVWVALMFWYGTKVGMLHRVATGQGPDPD